MSAPSSTPRAPPQTSSSSAQSKSQPPVSEDLKSQKFDLAISLHLHAWPALTVAVQNSWGGPASASKRDWFAGAVSDYFSTSVKPPPPAPSSSSAQTPSSLSSTALHDLQEDVECLLLQVMEDEFDARVEDDSEVDVAGKIVRSWGLCRSGHFAEVDQMFAAWSEREERRRARGGADAGPPIEVQEIEEEGEWSDEDGGVDVDADVDMDDAPPVPVPPRDKPAPEVDEDGFTKVVGKKRR